MSTNTHTAPAPLVLVTAAAAAGAGWLAGRVASGSERDHLRRAATHDPLTGLPNRAGWHAHAHRAISGARRTHRRVAVGLADVDGLKAVNDTVGHAAGDAMLTTVAQRLQRHIGAAGVAARLGGDEFALVLTGPADTHSPAWLFDAAHRLHQALCGPADLAGVRHDISVSVGLAPACDDFDVALAHADWAMYRVKHTPHNVAVYPT